MLLGLDSESPLISVSLAKLHSSRIPIGGVEGAISCVLVYLQAKEII